jgi:hypothetical protein
MLNRRRVCASVFDAPAFKQPRIFAPDGAKPRGTAQSASGRVDTDEEKLACGWHPCPFVATSHAQLQAHEWLCSRNWTQKLNPRSAEAKEESRQLARAQALRAEIAQPTESAEAAKLRERLASLETTLKTLSAGLDSDAAGDEQIDEQIQVPGTSEKGAQPKAPAAKKTTGQPGQEASRQQPIRAGKEPPLREQRALNAQRGVHPTWTVHEFAALVGMRVEDVLPDGNCFFLAWMRAKGFIEQAEARPSGGVLTPAVANKVLQLRRAALAHVDQHFLAPERPEAGPYRRVIADCSYNADMTGELSLETLKTQVRAGMAQLANLGAWRLERNNYIFNFIVCAVACLGETPILCVESHSRDNEVLHKHFKVYGDPNDPALKAFSHLAGCQQPFHRDFDLTNGRCDDGGELRRVPVDLSGLVVLYNQNAAHYQCLIRPAAAEDAAGDGSAMGAPSRSVVAGRTIPQPPVLRVGDSSSASRSCEVGPLGAASRSHTAASVPATNQTSSATEKSDTSTDGNLKRLEYVKRFAERLLQVDLEAVQIRRFGPSVCACMQHLYDGDAAAATSTRPKR